MWVVGKDIVIEEEALEEMSFGRNVAVTTLRWRAGVHEAPVFEENGEQPAKLRVVSEVTMSRYGNTYSAALAELKEALAREGIDVQ